MNKLWVHCDGFVSLDSVDVFRNGSWEMTSLSSFQLCPPSNWQDFEVLCFDLWSRIWKDSNTQLHGRLGQAQQGVDVFGRPEKGSNWAGVQCKGKDNYQNKTLTEAEVKAEVEKAKTFEPPLTEYIIATTGPKDATIEKLARKITEDHLGKGLFTVNVFGWSDIVTRLGDYPELVTKHWPEFGTISEEISEKIDVIKNNTEQILQANSAANESILSIREGVEASLAFNSSNTSSALASEHQAELDYSRELLLSHNPKQALEYLESLRKRIWHAAEPVAKYRLLTNIASARLDIFDNMAAGRLFVEAEQYNPLSDQAPSNASLGYLLLGDLDKARLKATEALQMNPANLNAYAVMIHAASNNLEETIAKIPKAHREMPEVAYTIAFVLRDVDLEKSKKYLEIALENASKDYSAELEADLASVQLGLVLEGRDFDAPEEIDGINREYIEKAKNLLDNAWSTIENTDLRGYRVFWIINRSIAKRLLGDIVGAAADADLAITIDYANPHVIKNRASIAEDQGNIEYAKILYESIENNDEVPEAAFLLALCYRDSKEYLKAINTLTNLLARDIPEVLSRESKRLLLALYLDTRESEPRHLEKAIELSEQMRKAAPTDVLIMSDAAILQKSLGDTGNAIALLQEAKSYINSKTPFVGLHQLANAFASTGQYNDAANIFIRIAHAKLDTPVTRQLIHCLFKAGRFGEALEICKALREEHGPLQFVTEIESIIYEEIADLPSAKGVCSAYLELFPGDQEMKLRLAVVNYRLGNFEELDDYLTKNTYEDMSLKARLQLAALYAARGMGRIAVNLMYETRRKFFSASEAHLAYVAFFFQRDKEEDDWIDVDKVGEGVAVCIEADSGGRRWYIIESRQDVSLERKELPLNHPLSKKLLGRSIGDKVVLSESHLSQEIGKIAEIKSKYVYALHETMESFEELFPGEPGMIRVKLGGTQGEAAKSEDFQVIFDEISRQYEHHLQIEQYYREGKLTLGAFASLIGRNVIEVWNGLMGQADPGIRCSHNSLSEINRLGLLLDNKPKLAVDIITLLTIDRLEIADSIVKAFGKLAVTQSTVDDLQQRVAMQKGIQSNGYMVLGKSGGEFVREEVSQATIKKDLKQLEDLLEWIVESCDVLPIKAALTNSKSLRKNLKKAIGSSFVDTMLIASEPGVLLFSDDEVLRALAKNELGVDGVWTQLAINKCLNNNIIDNDKYNKVIIKLVCSHYYHTMIDKEVIMEAARQSKWLPGRSYAATVRALRGSITSDASAINVAVGFLYDLFLQPILPYQKEYLVLYLIDQLILDRNPLKALKQLRSGIGRRFRLYPLAESVLLSIIEAWEKTHII